MKNKLLLKVAFVVILLFSFSFTMAAQAESNPLLSDGSYVAGQEIPAGLTHFSIQKGTAYLSILTTEGAEIVEILDSTNEFSSNQFTTRLKAGDEIEIFLEDGAAGVAVKQISAIDLKNLSAGFYQVGTDIPAGTYSFNLDKPADNYDYAMIEIFDNQGNYKESFDLSSKQVSGTYKLAKGDQFYLSYLSGTMKAQPVVTTPQSITLNKSSLSLVVGNTGNLTAAINPSTALDKSVTWKSSHPGIATVDAKGTVKAVKAGTATITATAKGAAGISKSIKVTVTNILPTSLKLSKSSLNISNNQKVKVTATISPANAADKTLIWKSSNTKVATVDSQGTIKGLVNGSATITATSKANAKIYKTVAVKVSTKTVKVNKTALSLMAGKTETLKATAAPADSVDKTVTWKSSNTKVATVDSKGKVTAKAKGTATVTATVKGAKEVKVKVTVTAPVAASSVKVNKTSFTLNKGNSYTLVPTVSPSNTTNKTIKWKSANTKIATVDSKGKVTAVGSGTVKITATTSNGKLATASVTVPYVKTLSAGKWKGGTHLPAGRYKMTTKSGSGNLFIAENDYNRFVNEILSSENDGFGVTAVTTDIKSGDSIEIMGLENVQFTRVANVMSNTLHSGYWTVGKDIAAGRYKITTTSDFGNLFIYRGSNLQVNEILTNKKQKYAVTSVTTTLKNGDRIQISNLNKVIFTKQ